MDSPVYTLEEAARFLKVNPVTIKRLVIRGKLRRVPFIRHYRIPKEDVHRMAEGVLA